MVPGPFARHLERVTRQLRAKGYDQLVRALRKAPPWLHRSPLLARANVVEHWIHHEDVRRARGDAPRVDDDDTVAILWASLGFNALVARRRVHGAGLVLRAPDGRQRVVRRDGPVVTVTGAPGELVLFMSGRKEAAAVELDGVPEAVAIVLAARFGL